jgi:hypothetical protein
MPNLLKLELEIGKFFQRWCPDFAENAQKLFNNAVDYKTRQLLNEKVSYDGMDFTFVASTEMFNAQPQFTVEASALFERAVQARLPKRKANAVNIKKVLREQIKLERVQGKIRRII